MDPVSREFRGIAHLQIPFFDDTHMVDDMAGYDEAEGQRIDRVAAGGACEFQLFVIQGAEQEFGGLSQCPELFFQVMPAAACRIGVHCPDILIEARQRDSILAGKAEGPVSEYSFRIDDML